MGITLKDFNKYKNDSSLYATLNDKNKKIFWDYGTSQGLVPMHLLNDNMKAEVSKYTSGSYKPSVAEPTKEDQAIITREADRFATDYIPTETSKVQSQADARRSIQLGTELGAKEYTSIPSTRQPYTTAPVPQQVVQPNFNLANHMQNLKESSLEPQKPTIRNPFNFKDTTQGSRGTLTAEAQRIAMEQTPASIAGTLGGIGSAFGIKNTPEQEQYLKDTKKGYGAYSVAGNIIGQIGGYGAVNAALKGTKLGATLVSTLGKKLGDKVGGYVASQGAQLLADAIVQAPMETVEAIQNDKSIGEDVRQILTNRAIDLAMNMAIQGGSDAFKKMMANNKVMQAVVDAGIPESEVIRAIESNDTQAIRGIQNRVNIKGKEYEVKLGEGQGSIQTAIKTPSLKVVEGQKLPSAEYSLGKRTDNLYTPEKPKDVFSIDDRSVTNVGKTNLKPYSQQNKEVVPFYQEAAKDLKADLLQTVKGQQSGGLVRVPDGRGSFNDRYVDTSTSREASESVTELLETLPSGPSYKQIEESLDRIATGQSKNALDKQIEVILDKRLTKGFRGIDGTQVKPDGTYINAKALGEFEATAPPIRIESPLTKRTLTKVPTVTTRKELPKLTASMGKEPVKLDGEYKLDVQQVPTGKLTTGFDAVKAEEGAPLKERGFSENTRTDTNRPDALRESIDKDKLFYEQLSNKTTLESAQARFDRGYETALEDFDKTKGDLRADNVPLAKLIADEATKRGDMYTARRVVTEIAESLTTAGQFSQAAKILRESNDPATILMFVEKELKRLNEQGLKRYGQPGTNLLGGKKGWNKIELTDDELGMIKKFTEEGTEEGKEKLFQDLFDSVSKRIPTTGREKFDSFRRMAMLFNPKTHIRNIVGNGIMAGVKKISDTISTGLEKKFIPADLRTKSLSASKQLKNTAQSYFDSNKKTLLDGDRWEVFGVKSPFADKRIFKNDLLQTLNDISKKTLEGEDVIFFKKHFVNDLAGFMNARGLSEPTDEAIKYATRRAQEATFRESNELAQAINALKGTKYGLIVEAAIPFTKTPANILKSGVDYSPIGVVKSMFELANKAEPTQVIETLSKGLTGSGLALTGYFMATNGMARGAYEKGKAEGLSTATGQLPNSIILPNGSYTIDWAQPAAIPFFMGVAVAEEMKKNKNADAVELGYKALKAGGDSLINSSMLKNVRELLGGEYGSPAEKLMGLPIEYAKQILPTLGGQIARSVDPVKREKDYSNLGSQLLTDAQSRIPLATKGLPAKYDLLGQPQTYGKFGLINTLNQFLNPGTVGTATQDPIIKEILRLYDTHGADAIPRTSISKFTEKGEYKLNNVEKSEFMRIMGEYTKNSLKAKLNTPEYKNSTDAEKVKIIKGINDDGYDKAKSAIISMRGAK